MKTSYKKQVLPASITVRVSNDLKRWLLQNNIDYAKIVRETLEALKAQLKVKK